MASQGALAKTTTKSLRQLQTSLKGTEQAAKGTTQQMPKLGQSTNQATFALTNLGRVASDAPFGLIGIANNIEPLIQSFVQLKASSASTGGALKALGSSLLGGGGLVLAISLLTSAAQFAVLGFDRWTGSTKKLKEEKEDLKTIEQEYANILAREKVDLENLYKTAINTAQSYTIRKQAADQLIKLYPEYLKGLDSEAIVAGKAANAYKLLADAIQKSALARAAANIQTQNQEKIIAAQFEIDKLREQRESKINDIKRKFIEYRKTETRENKISLSFSAELQEIENARLEFQNKIIEKQKEINSISADNNKLSLLIQQNQTQQFKLTGGLGDKQKEKTKDTQAELSLIVGIGSFYDELNKKEQERIQAQKDLNLLIEAENKLRKTGEKPPELTAQQQLAIVGSDASRGETGLNGLPQKIEQAKQLNETLQLSDQLINSIAGEFADLFTNLSKDGVKAFEDIAKSIAQTTQRILIQYAVTQALKALLNSIAPGSGELAGVAVNKVSNLDIKNLRILGGI